MKDTHVSTVTASIFPTQPFLPKFVGFYVRSFITVLMSVNCSSLASSLRSAFSDLTADGLIVLLLFSSFSFANFPAFENRQAMARARQL